jgi:hypothetical protein
MKAVKFLKHAVSSTDYYALFTFGVGTTIALFSKKHELFNGFQPVFYASLFGFMISLAFRNLWNKELPFTTTTSARQSSIIVSGLLLGILFLLTLALSLFLVWYISALQGLTVLENIHYWPRLLLLGLCLGFAYQFYVQMENRFLRHLFFK